MIAAAGGDGARSSTVPDPQHMNQQEAIAALRRALEDPVVEVRREAALALGRLGDAESTPALIEVLGSDREPVRRAAALALGGIETEESQQALLTALRKDVSVWREAAIGLSRQRGEAVVTGLTALLGDAASNEHARRGAALALGALLAGEASGGETVGPAVFEDEQGMLHVTL